MRSDGTPANVRVPVGWTAQHAPRPGVLMVMMPASPPRSGLAPCLTLTVGGSDLGPREHQEHLCGLARQTFDKVEIEDADIYDFQGADVGYIRFFHRTPRHDVIVEVWSWVTDGRVWSLVASADHRDHPDYCDVFDDVAATFDLSAARLAS